MNQKTVLKQLLALKKDVKEMRLAAEGWNAPWKTLIATILSAQTRDETTIKIATKLFEKYNTLDKLSKAQLADIQKIIHSINFYKNKSKNIINCAKALIKEHNGKIPDSIGELVKLPGVGRKTANVFISEYGKPGIAVDTHVFYISRYLGWSDKKNPDKVEEDLKKLFPKRIWSKVNPILVRFGKTNISKIKKNKFLDEIKKIR